MIIVQSQNDSFHIKKHTKNTKTQDTTTYQENLQINLIHIDKMNESLDKKIVIGIQNGKQETTQKKKISIIDPTKLLCFKTTKNTQISSKHQNHQKVFQFSSNNFNTKNIAHDKMLKTKKIKTQYLDSNHKLKLNLSNNQQGHQRLKTISYTSPINFTRLASKKIHKKMSNQQIGINQHSEKEKKSCIQNYLQQNYQIQLNENKFDMQMKRRMKYQSKKARYRIKIPQLLIFKKKKLKQDKIYLSHKLQESTSEFKINQKMRQDLEKMKKLFKKRAASLQLCFLY